MFFLQKILHKFLKDFTGKKRYHKFMKDFTGKKIYIYDDFP